MVQNLTGIESLGQKVVEFQPTRELVLVEGIEVPVWLVQEMTYNTDPELTLLRGGIEDETKSIVSAHVDELLAQGARDSLQEEKGYSSEHETSYDPGIYYKVRRFDVVGPVMGKVALQV